MAVLRLSLAALRAGLRARPKRQGTELKPGQSVHIPYTKRHALSVGWDCHPPPLTQVGAVGVHLAAPSSSGARARG